MRLIAFTTAVAALACATAASAQTADKFDLICTLGGGAPAKNTVSVDLVGHRFCIGSPVCRFSGAVGPVGATPDMVQLASDDPGVKVLLNLKSLNLTYRFGDPPDQHDRIAVCKASAFTPFDETSETLTVPVRQTPQTAQPESGAPPADPPPSSIVKPH